MVVSSGGIVEVVDGPVGSASVVDDEVVVVTGTGDSVVNSPYIEAKSYEPVKWTTCNADPTDSSKSNPTSEDPDPLVAAMAAAIFTRTGERERIGEEQEDMSISNVARATRQTSLLDTCESSRSLMVKFRAFRGFSEFGESAPVG